MDNPIFCDLIDRDDEDVPLGLALFVLAKEEFPELDIDRCTSKLDDMAEAVGTGLSPAANVFQTMAGINDYLYEQMGFQGNSADYYDPKNSFLHEVIDRRTGIPITLSILYMEIARRLGIELEGISFPGHFLLRGTGELGELLIDPFNSGKLLSTGDCADLLSRIFDDQMEFTPDLLHPASNKQILARVLNNLKSIYLVHKDYERALGAVNNMLIINPNSTEEIRDRGVIYYMLECFSNAYSDLSLYLERCPNAPDASVVKTYLPPLREFISKVN